MLAGSTPLVCIAGVHALQQIAQESPDMHRRQAIRLLAAFVRHPPRDNEHDSLASPAGSDVKSALEAIHACRTHAVGPAVELDLRGANLKQLKLDWIGLHGADLAGASLHGVRFDDVDLSGAELAGADLREAQLSGPEPQIPCALTEANLSGANMAGADLIGVDMRHSNLSGAILVGAHLDSADLRHADLIDADLTDASLAFAKLAGASLAGAILANTDLSGADFFTDDEALHDTSPVRGLRQAQLDIARAERDWPPKLGDAVKDTATGHPLTWHQTID